MQVLCEVRNRIAFITLNRPEALNALSLRMMVDLRSLLDGLGADAGINAVLIKGAGEKAFCAGGDVRSLYEAYRKYTDEEALRFLVDFFVAEYPLDFLLHDYPKPYIALLDGITMGGGMGLAQGSRMRIVGERTRMAMPEVAIGFFPDVGGSYFLSRLPGSLGAYLALTGTSIRAADALYAGLADVYMPRASVGRLEAELANLQWSGDALESRRGDIAAVIQRLSAAPPEPLASPALPPLAALRPAIDAHFAAVSVKDLLNSLRSERSAEHAHWAAETLAVLQSRSPTMLEVALRQMRRGKSMSLADCLRMEIGMTWQCFRHGDFMEGVRAKLVDKDEKPAWRPQHIEDVTEAAVEKIFENPWAGRAHPLDHLLGVP